MKNNKNKFTTQITECLIKIRHSNETIQKIEEALNNPIKMKKIWESIAVELGNEHSAKSIKEKYNQLLTKYREQKDKQQKSGEGNIVWRYWNLFNNTFPKKVKLSMENVEELGHGSENIVNKLNDDNSVDLISVDENKKITSKQKLNNLRIQVLEKLIKSDENDAIDKRVKKIENKFYDVEKKLEKLEKLDIILELLKKQKKN